MSEATGGPHPHGPSYSEHYSEGGFRKRAKTYLRRAGREVGEKVLCLYYTLEEPQLPAWARSVIYGALGYFLTPWDAAPDFIPGAGYADDLGVVTAALATVAAHVTPHARQRARAQLDRWLG
ncbi:YkvA family protein [Thiohalorhabdus methylotrophus]|uniref:YkvA family protein n=1 Tax=Thiohalorhabdus methylotrophus TaxID=3242694 RepID=A0ABV4TTN9_9GAMM